MMALSTQNRSAEIYNSIIKRISDVDILNSVIIELYNEEDINASFGVYESGDIPDIQNILVSLVEEHTETIEYFYTLCEEDDLIPGALERYQEEVFPMLEDTIKLCLMNAGYIYRDSSQDTKAILNDRAISCQNSLFSIIEVYI